MKKLFIAGVIFALASCSTKLQTPAGPIEFEITPEMVEQIFRIATIITRGDECRIQGIQVDEKIIAIIPDDAESDLAAWGHADGILTRSEAVFIKARSEQLKKDFVFQNRQGGRIKVIYKARKNPQ